jgi:hypothetical protein
MAAKRCLLRGLVASRVKSRSFTQAHSLAADRLFAAFRIQRRGVRAA